MKVNSRILSLAFLITLLSMYLFPCHQINVWQKSFGYPFGWFTVYHDKIGNTIVSSTSVSLALFIDIIIWYFVILFLYRIYKRIIQGKKME